MSHSSPNRLNPKSYVFFFENIVFRSSYHKPKKQIKKFQKRLYYVQIILQITGFERYPNFHSVFQPNGYHIQAFNS
ncbi:hypothetical protein BpHYR1_051522 [Brachionus plicatilis]|uniref:Uncharacterized protein n=1 Tax=Brachionus plicatilis TaxID=10195 RepID=A0A3M7R977_BRAPC|nr:hypothetical protein BpHYR1_051522 [Brachionus plicatilis]